MKKTITILMVLAFLTLSKNVVAQSQTLFFNYSNTSNCSWEIRFYDNASNLLYNYTISAGTSGSSSCAISITAAVSFIRLIETGLNCQTINFGNCSTGCQQTNIVSICNGGLGCSSSSPIQTITIYSITACQPSPPQQAYDIIIVP
ncbi:MAG: hypothetical protein HUU47_09630 [Bacteroidetes bacterium]|nr:hypothetical protein [Bacteroidota bacterium]